MCNEIEALILKKIVQDYFQYENINKQCVVAFKMQKYLSKRLVRKD